jgi:tetratricopeptide (TPR) repeat protein
VSKVAEPANWDQGDLFSGDAARTIAAREHLAALRFPEAVAAYRACSQPHGLMPLASALAAVPKGRGRRAVYEHLLACLAVDGLEREPWLRARILAAAGRALEQALGEGAVHGGLCAGSFWLEAGELGQAVRSLTATLAANPRDTEARLLLGSAQRQRGELEAARITWMLALWHDPLGVDVDLTDDLAVMDLAGLAEELVPESEGDPRLWIVPLGLIEGVFPLTSRLEGDDDLLGGVLSPDDRARLVARVVVHSDRGHDDVAARRAVKRHAPWLLPRLVGRR